MSKMRSQLLFLRRLDEEIKLQGGEVYIDIDGKNIGKLGKIDLKHDVMPGNCKIKMYLDHIDGTHIGFAEEEIKIETGENLIIEYVPPYLINQAGNLIISKNENQETVKEYITKKEEKLRNRINNLNKEKEDSINEVEKTNNQYILYFVIFIVIIFGFSYCETMLILDSL